MKTLLAPLGELGEYEDIMKALCPKAGKVGISGCVDSQKLHMIFGTEHGFETKLIVTYSDIKARELLEDCRLYCPDSYFYPARDLIFYQVTYTAICLQKSELLYSAVFLSGGQLRL